MSADTCKTVCIVAPVAKGNPHGFTEINESDFDPAVHTLFEPKPETAGEKIAREQNAFAAHIAATAVKIIEVVASKSAPPAVEPPPTKNVGWGDAPPA
jgi:hypothetical protein